MESRDADNCHNGAIAQVSHSGESACPAIGSAEGVQRVRECRQAEPMGSSDVAPVPASRGSWRFDQGAV